MSTYQPTGTPLNLPDLVGGWELDLDATTIEFRTKAMWGMAKVVGHFRAAGGTAEVATDGSVSGTLVVDAASVDTRQSQRDKHLRGDQFFDVDNHPTFTYTATGLDVGPEGYVVKGTFTARGATKPLDMHATIVESSATDRTLTIAGHAEIDRREWGIDTVKLGSGVQIALQVQAVYRSTGGQPPRD